MLPDEQAGALDVVRVGEADERAVAGLARALKRKQRQYAFTHAALPVEHAHAHLGPRVAAYVPVPDGDRDLIGGQNRGQTPVGAVINLLGGNGDGRDDQDHSDDKPMMLAHSRLCESIHNDVKFWRIFRWIDR
jgi:hypothetical protein